MKSLLRTQGSPGPGHWRFCIGRGVARIAIVAMCFETFAVSGFGSAILASSVALLSHFAFVTYHNRVTRAFAKHGYQWSRKSFLVNGQQETRNVLTWSLK